MQLRYYRPQGERGVHVERRGGAAPNDREREHGDAADMNRLPELELRADWFVCRYAVHHLVEPPRFFAGLLPHLPADGGVLCFREPAVPRFALPGEQIPIRDQADARKRAQGEIER